MNLHSLISGTSIWETGRVLALLLPALDPPDPLPVTCLASPVPPDRTLGGGLRLSDSVASLTAVGNLSHLPPWPPFTGLGNVFLLWFGHRVLPLCNLATA